MRLVRHAVPWAAAFVVMCVACGGGGHRASGAGPLAGAAGSDRHGLAGAAGAGLRAVGHAGAVAPGASSGGQGDVGGSDAGASAFSPGGRAISAGSTSGGSPGPRDASGGTSVHAAGASGDGSLIPGSGGATGAGGSADPAEAGGATGQAGALGVAGKRVLAGSAGQGGAIGEPGSTGDQAGGGAAGAFDCSAAGDPDPGTPCTVGVGACLRGGVTLCRANGVGTECSAAPGSPSEEVCNYVDDDCNGETDEPFSTLGNVCSDGLGACERFGVIICGANGNATRCSATRGNPAPEACNGVDDDCNGDTDEDYTELGESCSEGIGACERFGVMVCTAGGEGTECSAIAGTGSTEQCNGVDDDCNGETDETFRNEAGDYVSDHACGNCQTDCTAIYARPGASGYCSTSAAPVCVLQCDSGRFDFNLDPIDGCEFVLDEDAIYVSATDPSASDDAGCGRGPVGTGSENFPCLSIRRGLEEAADATRSRVLVADGLYPEAVTLAPGIDLLGAYSPDTWERHLEATITVIAGPHGDGHRKAVTAVGIQTPTLFEGFVVQGARATTAGTNCYAIYVRNSTGALTLRNNIVRAGEGARGQAGSAGANGTPGVPGSSGSATMNTTCTVGEYFTTRAGAGGSRLCGTTDVGGGTGGAPRCPDIDQQSGAGVTGRNSGGSGGPGGWGHRSRTTGSCSPTANQLEVGTPGAVGAAVLDGASGAGCSAAVSGGAVVAGEWVGGPGGAAISGQHGRGGGGGGSGGGQRLEDVLTFDLPGGGGGGGSGGCAGTAGTGGSAGGGSFGIFITFDSTPADAAGVPLVTMNAVTRNYGGPGGDGGAGGAGGGGGLGGVGGAVVGYSGPIYCIFGGAAGGAGSRGGHGGGGGGGCGGVSYDIAAFGLGGVDSTSRVYANTFSLDAGTPTSGAGGAAGPTLSTSWASPGAAGGYGQWLVVD